MLTIIGALVATAGFVTAADENTQYHPHAVVAFIRSGERIPSIISSQSGLSALGSQQMYTLGQLFRGRYIDGETGDTRIGEEPISGMSRDSIDNDQLLVQATDTPYVFSSAQAFMQGLYPPLKSNGSSGGEKLTDGTTAVTPLDGYQYAQIEALSMYEYNSIYIAGDHNCPSRDLETREYETTEHYLSTKMTAQDFYQDLDLDMFDGRLTKRQLDYHYASEIYEYLDFQDRHNESIHDKLANSTTLDVLSNYANQKTWYEYGNTSESTSDNDYRAMAGKTLAARILGTFQDAVRTKANLTLPFWQPLTLLFGEAEPMISLASLIMLEKRNTNMKKTPPFASALIFELYSTGQDPSFPADPDNDLWVRLRFQNGTDLSQGSPQSYSMFNNPFSQTDMPWKDFNLMFGRIMVTDPADWCEQCDSPSLFCSGVDRTRTIIAVGGNGRLGSQGKVSPTIAGVIGAVVTLAVAGLIFAFAMLVGGVRLHRVERGQKSGLGGFKGSAKLASDQDLNLSKNAAAPAGAGATVVGGADRKAGHERVGSWELRQKEFGESRRESFEAIEAAMGRPVVPSERV